jgi:dTMP kinase
MFITFEGIEGMGKTTHLQWMAQKLNEAHIPIILTREPGGTPMGEEIRDVLLAHRHEKVAVMTELLLMFAARAQHIEMVIQKALDEKKWVLCDRFIDATYAYQGGGRGVKKEIIAQLESLVLPHLKPDYTLIFDAPAEIGLKRVQERKQAQDRIEQEKIDFFERVRQAYLMNATSDPTRYRIIDATKPLAEVQETVSIFLNKLLADYHVNA